VVESESFHERGNVFLARVSGSPKQTARLPWSPTRFLTNPADCSSKQDFQETSWHTRYGEFIPNLRLKMK